MSRFDIVLGWVCFAVIGILAVLGIALYISALIYMPVGGCK